MLRRKSKTQLEHQERNTISKTQLLFELFKAHCAATFNAKNAGFHNKNF
jgi:hypothetical protein